jgi:ABC-type nickel/cobalt efflux system permease component RcnA
LEGAADQRDAHIEAVAGAVAAAPADTAAIGAAERVTRWFTNLTGRPHLTAGIGLLSLMLALVLGAGHALAPGHGKTVMAAYLVGRHGRRRDALSVAGVVTTTHTLGVLVLGIVIAASYAIAPKSVYQWLAIANGLLLAGVGAVLLRRALRSRFHGAGSPAPGRITDPGHHHAQGDHSHDHHDGHSHPHHHHHHDQTVSRRTILALGFAGGLAPSPSAVVVLLGAAALGRAWFGVLLVVAYGLGMAAALVGIGLMMARFIDRLGELVRRRWLAVAFGAAPVVTAVVITFVGIAVAGQALMFG